MEKANAGVPAFIEVPQARIDALWWSWATLQDDDAPEFEGGRALIAGWLLELGQIP